MHNKNNGYFPIGIFDSGVGGLSVWREIIKLIPGHPLLYFADNAYCPYGPRPKEEIISRTEKITSFLIDRGAAIIVVACNTATSAAISSLRERFNVPFVGMEPAVKPAANFSKSGVIGVLATKGTLSGELYNSTLEKYASEITVVEKVGAGLVALVEEGKLSGPETEKLLRVYIEPMLEEGADNIVLGCTHYPFLQPEIEKIAGKSVNVLDPAPAVAKQLVKIAKELEILKDESSFLNTQFYSSGPNDVLKSLARTICPDLNDDRFEIINL
ncbi:MAG: glutamate racemase [Bacteroidales bacterium]